MLNIVDEFTHECLAIRVARKLKSGDVIDALSDLIVLRGAPEYIRSDNGPEFIAEAVKVCITAVDCATPTSSVARAGPKAADKLTWKPDNFVGASQRLGGLSRHFERAYSPCRQPWRRQRDIQ